MLRPVASGGADSAISSRFGAPPLASDAFVPDVPGLRHAEAVLRAVSAQTHRELVHRLEWVRPFSTRASRSRVLIVSEPGRVPESQIHPLLFYGRELGSAHVEVREISVKVFEASPSRAPHGADVIVLQAWVPPDAERYRAVLDALRQANPGARTVFFDAFAPTDLRLAAPLGDAVDLYVKKHVLRDRAAYGRATRGDTNLTDYYGRLYGIDHPERSFEIPPGFFGKLRVGPSFFTGRTLLPFFFASAEPLKREKVIDVHARICTDGTDWYARMRLHAREALVSMADLKLVSDPGVPYRRYLAELCASKLCFSPFGYGEVSWRDYEAVLCGALLLKPDMSHCETWPDIFVPFETYVPIRWDFSDLEEKTRYYLAHESEREQIAQRAYTRLHQYSIRGEFLGQMRDVVEP